MPVCLLTTELTHSPQEVAPRRCGTGRTAIRAAAALLPPGGARSPAAALSRAISPRNCGGASWVSRCAARRAGQPAVWVKARGDVSGQVSRRLDQSWVAPECSLPPSRHLYSPRPAFNGIAQLPTAAQPAWSGRGCCSVAGWVGFFAPSRCHSDCGPGRDTGTRRRRQHSHSTAGLRGAVRYRWCAGAGGSGAGLPPRSPAFVGGRRGASRRCGAS